MRKKLKWSKVSPGSWYSACGRYHVWIQTRPREDGSLWAAERLGVPPWLNEGDCDSRLEAQEVCQEHADMEDAGVIAWSYQGNEFLSPICAKCPLCGALAIILLPAAVLAKQTDSTTHVCHPLAGGCNHGFDTQPEASP